MLWLHNTFETIEMGRYAPMYTSFLLSKALDKFDKGMPPTNGRIFLKKYRRISPQK